MIWFYFLTGLLIGMLSIAIASIVVMFQTHIRHQEEKGAMFDSGFNHGRDWKSYELDWAREEIKEIRDMMKEMEHEDPVEM